MDLQWIAMDLDLSGLANLVLSERHESVHLRLHAAHPLRPPHEPELEDVVVAAALDHLVARVVPHVVVLVLLEQVLRRHRVAVVEQALCKERKLNEIIYLHILFLMFNAILL